MPVQTEVKSNGVTSVPAAPPKRKQSRRWMLVALLVLVLLAAAIAVLLASRARSAPSYETTAVVRGHSRKALRRPARSTLKIRSPSEPKFPTPSKRSTSITTVRFTKGKYSRK